MVLPLPLEIYHSIIEQIDEKRDLCSLALCCSAFRDEAQRCLFHAAQPAPIIRQTQFLSAINSKPLHLGPLVHTFCVDGRDSNGNVFASLSQALRAMHYLKHLRLFGVDRPSTVMHGCAFQLSAFDCISTLTHREALFLLCDFLPTQKSIKHLEMYVAGPLDVDTVPKDPCPQLESLRCNQEGLVKILLPDARPIPNFQWFTSHTPPPLSVHQLNHIKSLEFGINMSGPNTAFTAHLISLVNLKLDAIVMACDNLSHNLCFLRNIPHLRYLHLLIREWDILGSNDKVLRKFSPAFQRAFELCPGLIRIDVTYASVAATDMRLVRETRDEKHAAEIKWRLGWSRFR